MDFEATWYFFMNKKLLFVVVTICFFIFCLKLIYIEHISSNLETIEFIIKKPYLVVVAELGEKESLEEAIENSGAKLISKEWKNFELIKPDKRLRFREYKLFGDLNFKILKNDLYLGVLSLDFNQKINLNKEEFRVETKLSNANKKILNLNKTIIIYPNEGKLIDNVKVKIKSEIKIKNKIPFFMSKIMDEKLKKSNMLDLEKTKNFLIKKLN